MENNHLTNVIRKTVEAVTKAEKNNRRLVVRISTGNPDRSNDEVQSKGVVLDNYLKNPVVAFAHNYSGVAIAKAVDIKVKDNEIVATVEFPPQGVSPLSDQLFELYKGDFMRAWSIGFRSLEYTEKENGGYVFDKWELLEFSAVLVPDNPEALTIGKGVKTDAIKTAIDHLSQKQEPDPNKPIKVEPVPTEDEPEKDDSGATDSPAGSEDNPNPESTEEPMEVTSVSLNEEKKTMVLTFKDGTRAVVGATPEFMTAFKNAEIVEKEGRVLSASNLKVVKAAIEALTKLVEASEKEDNKEDGKAVDNNLLVSIRDGLRKTDKEVGLNLRAINEALKQSREQSKGGDN